MTAHDTPPEELRERPIGDLVKQLASRTSHARPAGDRPGEGGDVASKASIAGKGAGLLGGAALVGLLAAGALTACLILVLSEAMDAWLAALIVAVVMAAVAAGLVCAAATRSARPPHPYRNRPSRQ